MAVRVRLTGNRAVFAQGNFTTDLVSYDVMTPHAARGALNAIHREPAMVWAIDTITILRPILRECLHQGDRRVVMLRSVDYVIDGHVEDTAGNATAQEAQFARAIATAPSVYLGHIGCKATATMLDPAAPPIIAPGTLHVDHGWLLYGVDPASGRPRYFRAESIGGVIRVPGDDSPLLFG